MAAKVSGEELKVISDSRGLVLEPVGAEDFPDLKNAHIVVSLPGVVRGDHFHMRGKETIAVLGPALVRCREDDEAKDIEIPSGRAYRFVFAPGVSHAIKNLSNSLNILMAFNTEEHDPLNPDTESSVLIVE